MKKVVSYFVVVLGTLLVMNSTPLHAQGKSNNAPGRTKPNSPTGVPIDGGTGFLLAAGAAYGLKKLREYRNSSKRKEPNP